MKFTLSPRKTFKSLKILWSSRPGKRIIAILFSIGYLYSIFLLFLSLLKIIFPDTTGIFVYPNGGFYFGILMDSKGLAEISGYYFVPLCIFLSILLYGILSALMPVVEKKELKPVPDVLSFYLSITAKVLLFAWALFWLWFGFASGIAEQLDFMGIIIHSMMPGGVFLIIVLISLMKERIRIPVLFLTGIFISVAYPLTFGKGHLNWIIFVLPVMALPPLVSAFLLVYCKKRIKRVSALS